MTNQVTGFGPPDTIEISIELNTMITNATNDDDVVQGLTYTGFQVTRLWVRTASVQAEKVALESRTITDIWGQGDNARAGALGRRHGDHVGDPHQPQIGDAHLGTDSPRRCMRMIAALAGRLLSEASWPMPLRWEMAKISPRTVMVSGVEATGIELNTAITNATDNKDVVGDLTYTPSATDGLGEEEHWNTEVLSDDGMAITWAILSRQRLGG